MKKLFYLVVVAISIFALNSCEKEEDTNNPSNDPTYEYYKPIIGEWTTYEWYGSAVNDSGLEEPFNFSKLLENGDITATFLFDENMNMTQKISYSEETVTNNGKVAFEVNIPNYFTVNYTNGKQFFEIVSVSSDKLHLISNEDGSVSHFVCKK